MIDAISEAVENTEAKEHWEEYKPDCERALDNLLNCEQSANVAAYVARFYKIAYKIFLFKIEINPLTVFCFTFQMLL